MYCLSNPGAGYFCTVCEILSNVVVFWQYLITSVTKFTAEPCLHVALFVLTGLLAKYY